MTNSTNFVDQVTVITAAWANDVNAHVYNYTVDAGQYISTTNTAGQNNAGWSTMLSYIASQSLSGVKVQVPAGTFLFSTTLSLSAGMTVAGAGKTATTFSFSQTSEGMSMLSPLNSSTAVYTVLQDIKLFCTNGSSTKAGYFDRGGTFVQLKNCMIKGFAYSVVFDQTELGDILDCDFETFLTGGVWLTNGADYTVGSNAGYTNRISIQRCQFNGSGTSIIDDGGVAHEFSNNNFNGGINSIRVAGCLQGLTVRGSEFEATSGAPIRMTNTTSVLASNVGGSNLLFQGNLASSTNAVPVFSVNATGASQILTSIGNGYSGLGVKVNFDTQNGFFHSIGDNLNGGTLSNIASYYNSFIAGDFGAFTPVLAFGGASTGITYSIQQGRYQKWGLTVFYELQITLTSKGSSTGAATITGLPYSNSGGFTAGISVNYASDLVTATSTTGYILSGSSTINLVNAAFNPSGNLTDANVSNTSVFLISGQFTMG